MPDPEKLTAVREALPALSAGIYLNTGSVGPMPAETAAAMADMANYERDLGRAHPDYFLESLARMDEARAGVAAILGTDVGAVGLTHSTTDAMNAATLLPDWRAGGRVVTSAHEHQGGVGPLYAVRDRNGVELVFVDAGADGDDDRTLAAFDAAITPDTRLVSISHVLWTTGAVMPVARIAEIAHDRGAIVVVDGAQGVPHLPVDVAALGADFYAWTGHKAYGPTGIGVLHGRRELLEAMPPWLGGGHMIKRVGRDESTYMEPPARFEAGTSNIAEAIGLGAAVDFLGEIGMDEARAHGREIATYALERLGEVEGLTMYGPLDVEQRGGAIAFNLEGVHPHDVSEILGREGVCIRAGHHCAQPLMRRLGVAATSRASFAVHSTRDDVDRLIDALGSVRGVFG